MINKFKKILPLIVLVYVIAGYSLSSPTENFYKSAVLVAGLLCYIII